MIPFTGHILNTGHLTHPTANATGQSVMIELPEKTTTVYRRKSYGTPLVLTELGHNSRDAGPLPSCQASAGKPHKMQRARLASRPSRLLRLAGRDNPQFSGLRWSLPVRIRHTRNEWRAQQRMCWATTGSSCLGLENQPRPGFRKRLQ
jgi:hypothetical protein